VHHEIGTTERQAQTVQIAHVAQQIRDASLAQDQAQLRLLDLISAKNPKMDMGMIRMKVGSKRPTEGPRTPGDENRLEWPLTSRHRASPPRERT